MITQNLCNSDIHPFADVRAGRAAAWMKVVRELWQKAGKVDPAWRNSERRRTGRNGMDPMWRCGARRMERLGDTEEAASAGPGRARALAISVR
jgi:hypothetical protein